MSIQKLIIYAGAVHATRQSGRRAALHENMMPKPFAEKPFFVAIALLLCHFIAKWGEGQKASLFMHRQRRHGQFTIEGTDRPV